MSKIVLLGIQGTLTVAGVLLLTRYAPALRCARSSWTQNSLLVLVTLIFCSFALEGALRTGWFDNLDDPAPVWIPDRYRQMEHQIVAKTLAISSRNRFGFNDPNRSPVKPSGASRVAVLGDSFVWGYGVPADSSWPHLLEDLVRNEFENVEVMSWGQGGWSTKKQLAFLREHGVQFDIDLLLVGWVTNDPDVGLVPRKNLDWHLRSWSLPLKGLWPNAWTFFTDHVNRFLEHYVLKEHGYANWENALYEEDNLRVYREILVELAKVGRENGFPVVVVFTPNNWQSALHHKFLKVAPLMDEIGLPHLDLWPATVERFSSVNPRHLWASPSDGHPGTRMTPFFAREVFAYLKQERALELGWRPR